MSGPMGGPEQSRGYGCRTPDRAEKELAQPDGDPAVRILVKKLRKRLGIAYSSKLKGES